MLSAFVSLYHLNHDALPMQGGLQEVSLTGILAVKERQQVGDKPLVDVLLGNGGL